MNKSILWTKDFIIISSTTFFVALTFYLLMTTLAVYTIDQFGASQSQAGIVSGIFVIGSLISRLLAGKYMELIGRKKLLYGSLVLFLIATLLYFPVENLMLLIVVRFIHGVAFGISTTVLATVVTDIIPSERRGEGIGYYSLSPTMATAIGPFLGLFITQHADFNMMFIVCTFFSVSSIVMVSFSHIPEARITREQIEAIKGFNFKDFFGKDAVPISIIMLLMGIAYSGILSFLNSYAIGISLISAASFFFIVYAVFILISRPFTGRLLDIKGDNIVMYPALLLFALSLVLLSITTSGFILLVSGALVGLGFGTIMSCAQAIAVKESPKHQIGLATSTFFLCMDLGMGTGPFLIGMIIPIVGFRGMYMTLAGGVSLSIFLYYFVHGKNAVSR